MLNKPQNQNTEPEIITQPVQAEISEPIILKTPEEENKPIEPPTEKIAEEVQELSTEPKQKNSQTGQTAPETVQTPIQPPKPKSIAQTPPQQTTQPPTKITPPRGTTFSRDFIQNLLVKARAKIQERKRKKLDKIMALFETKPQIANKDIQKLLHMRKRTATRYLEQLEQEQKIIQIGKTGRGVLYVKK